MKIQIHSAELQRMMKTVVQCIDQRNLSNGNIEVIHNNNMLSIRGCNGQISAVVSAPVLGGDGESFCVDGTMFNRVAGMCNGEVTISTEGRVCLVKGLGRTRLPIVDDAKIPAFERVRGNAVTVKGEDFSRCYGNVAYAISADQSRMALTGVLTETDGQNIKMTTLDGFQMSVEETACEGDAVKAIIPGAFMKLVAGSVFPDDKVTLTFSSGSVQVETDGMLLRCGLLVADFPDVSKLIPKNFAIMCKVSVDAVRNALKAGNAVNNKQNLVKLDIAGDMMTVRNNSEQADFEAEIACDKQGADLKIAFNEKYLMNTLSAIDTDEVMMNFNSALLPVVVRNADGNGTRMVLPVRVME